jgi:hypothetical protein
MKTKFFLFAGLLAACLTSCSEMDEFADNNSYVDDGKSIKIEVTDEFAQATTRANYSGFPATTFEEGDAIGVYAFNGSSYVSSNVKFTRQSDGTWTPASTVVYNPDYTYYAYFPWVSSTPSIVTSGDVDARFANFITSNTFWKTDQSSKANFTASNLMAAQGVVTGERTVKFTMAHKRGLAIISDAVNQWYYTDAAGTKYNLTPVFSGNIPYEESGTRYFLMIPNTATSVAGLSLRAGAGKYMTSAGIEMTGNSVTYQYSTNGGSSFSSTKPSWLPVPEIVSGDGEPTMFSVSPDHSKTTSTVIGDPVISVLASNALSGKTTLSDVDLSMVDNAGNARATRTTANCYLVHNPGTYKIPLVYGNAIVNGETNSLAYHATSSGNNIKGDLVNHADAAITDPWLKNNSATPDGAELLWQDVNGMITAVGIEGDYLTFTVAGTAAGNAVIAAKMGSTIVWSWHIWVTDETLSATTAVNASSHTYAVAGVNVGWVSDKVNTTYQGSSCVVRATCNGVTLEFTVQQPNHVAQTSSNGRNPYYQWGRKDPEIPMNLFTNYNCNTYDISGNAVTTSSGNTITTVSGAYSIGTTIQNPQKHYYNSSNYGPYNENKYNYWDINQNSTGAITTATVKTVYDPCPPGFCVPTGKLYNWMNLKTGTWTSTTNQQGRMLNSYNIFFPASGRRNSSNSQLDYGGLYGYCWSASAFSSSSGCCLYFDSSSFVWHNSNRSSGYSVRPVAEE